VVVVIAIIWCCSRLYFVVRRKGYRPVGATVLVMASAFAGFIIDFAALGMLPTEEWSEVAENGTVIAAVLLVPFATVAAAVWLSPRRRNRVAGERRVSFLFSPWMRRLDSGSRIVGVILIGAGLSAPVWWSWNEGLRLVYTGLLMLGVRPLLAYYRGRASRPGLEQTIRTDLRRPVLYLRPFAREGDAFTWLPNKQIGQYTRTPISNNIFRVWKVSVEQYLTPALTETVGPVLALGNPLDTIPPEGAARIYASDDTPSDDEGWKRQFRTLAAGAAAMLMTAAWSDQLQWELREIRRRDWHTKLFLVTPPRQQQSMWVTDRLFAALVESARGAPRRPWTTAVRRLHDSGYRVDRADDPPPGSVLTFTADGAPILLARDIRQPEGYAVVVRRHVAERTPPNQIQQRGDWEE
jgi:hypothetical protein